MASRRRSTRSVRQSLVSSMAARVRWPWCFSSLASKRSNSVKASAVAPAKPASTVAVVELAHLACRALDDDVAQGDLAIAANGDLHALRRLAADAENGGAVKYVCCGESIAAAGGGACAIASTHRRSNAPQQSFSLARMTQACSLIPITLKNTAISGAGCVKMHHMPLAVADRPPS